MSSIELFFLDTGLSYTLSKLFAYLVFPLIGFLVWLIVKRWMKKKVWKISSLIALCVVSFFIYFMQYPIYEGDFSNNSSPIAAKSELNDIQSEKLVVISIPDCPFCQQSIRRMVAFRQRHPKVKIEYRVCVNDSLAKKAVERYMQLSDNKIPVSKAEDSKNLAMIADMSFPTFVLVTPAKKVKWSNNNFGVGALDEVVNTFEK